MNNRTFSRIKFLGSATLAIAMVVQFVLPFSQALALVSTATTITPVEFQAGNDTCGVFRKDYAEGEAVVVEGSGFAPNEAVTLSITGAANSSDSGVVVKTLSGQAADANGYFCINTGYIVSTNDDGTYVISANGFSANYNVNINPDGSGFTPEENTCTAFKNVYLTGETVWLEAYMFNSYQPLSIVMSGTANSSDGDGVVVKTTKSRADVDGYACVNTGYTVMPNDSGVYDIFVNGLKFTYTALAVAPTITPTPSPSPSPTVVPTTTPTPTPSDTPTPTSSPTPSGDMCPSLNGSILNHRFTVNGASVSSLRDKVVAGSVITTTFDIAENCTNIPVSLISYESTGNKFELENVTKQKKFDSDSGLLSASRYVSPNNGTSKTTLRT